MKIALLGTRGAPARYGGFETAVEEIGAGLVELGHEVTVYCRGDHPTGKTYRGMRRVVLPAMHRKALETLSHTGLSALHAIVHRPDVAFVFNAANAPFVAMLRAAGIPTALNVDGHDARRAKWSGAGKRYYRWATHFGIRVANRVVIDSRAIQADLGLTDDPKAVYIPYGARAVVTEQPEVRRLVSSLGLSVRGYHLVVARFEPENHVLEIIQGYSKSSARLPLVVVGFAGYPGEYTARIDEAATADQRVRLVGAVWDQALLDALYAGARTYLHGHSVGGTNPSLLRAMAHHLPIVAFDCPYNRETTGGIATWFQEPQEVATAVDEAEAREPLDLPVSPGVPKRYRWPAVVANYEATAHSMSAASTRSG